MPELDLFTTLVSMLVVSTVCSVVILSELHLSRKTYPGMPQWSLMFVCQGLGILLLLLKNVLPDFLSIWIAIGLFVGGIWFCLWGMELFLGVVRGHQREFILFTTFMLLNVYWTFFSPDVNLRSINMSFFMAVFFSLNARTLIFAEPREMREVTRASGYLHVMLALVFLARILVLVRDPYLDATYLKSRGFEVVFFLIFEGAYVLMAASLVVMVNRRLRMDLQQQKEAELTRQREEHELRQRLLEEKANAVSKVKILSGMLPICSSCKNIRDDQGYWKQIEDYIHTHSQAEFSHGLCPGCARKLYPDLYSELSGENS